jgi:hypothetical protein
MLYQFNTLDNSILKVVCLVLALIFAFISVLAFESAISDSVLAKKKVNILVDVGLLLLLVFGFSYAFGRTEILLLVPLVALFTYVYYIDVNYLVRSNQSSKNSSHDKRNSANVSRKLFTPSLAIPMKSIYSTTFLLMFFVFIIFVFYVKNLVPLPEAISNLYSVSLTIYTFVLGAIIAFAILILRPPANKRHTKDMRRALLGLAQICLVFTLTSFLGMLIGIKIDSSIFATEATLIDILGSSKILSLLQVFVFEFILLSFPPTFMYLYAMLKGFIYPGK